MNYITKTRVLFVLTISFLSYNVLIYTSGGIVDQKVGDGRLVWQKYNCQSCHQLYGLGGYLGPDLTNLMSEPGKTDAYLKAFIKSGTQQMPVLGLSDGEINRVLEFLKGVDRSGDGRVDSFEKEFNGMIRERYD